MIKFVKDLFSEPHKTIKIGDLVYIYPDRHVSTKKLFPKDLLKTGLIVEKTNAIKVYQYYKNNNDKRAVLYAGEAIGTHYKRDSQIPIYYKILIGNKTKYYNEYLLEKIR